MVHYTDRTRHSSTMPDRVHLILNGRSCLILLLHAVNVLASGYDHEPDIMYGATNV